MTDIDGADAMNGQYSWIKRKKKKERERNLKKYMNKTIINEELS